MLTTRDGTSIPAGFEARARQLRGQLRDEAAHWEERAPELSTDWTRYNDFLSDVFGTLPESRHHGGGGHEPDDVLRNLLRLLSIRQRLAVECEYRLWSSEEETRIPEAVIAYALDLTVHALRVELSDARQTLMHYREPFLVQLAFAQLRQAG